MLLVAESDARDRVNGESKESVEAFESSEWECSRWMSPRMAILRRAPLHEKQNQNQSGTKPMRKQPSCSSTSIFIFFCSGCGNSSYDKLKKYMFYLGKIEFASSLDVAEDDNIEESSAAMGSKSNGWKQLTQSCHRPDKSPLYCVQTYFAAALGTTPMNLY